MTEHDGRAHAIGVIDAVVVGEAARGAHSERDGAAVAVVEAGRRKRPVITTRI